MRFKMSCRLVILATLSTVALSCASTTVGVGGATHRLRHRTYPVAHSSPSHGQTAHGPVATFAPVHGPVGTLVRVTGLGFDPSLAKAPFVTLTLNREFPDGCGLVGGARPIKLRVNKEGRLAGEFIVTAQGQCFQEPGHQHMVTPGVYQVAVGCMACNVGSFRVTRR